MSNSHLTGVGRTFHSVNLQSDKLASSYSNSSCLQWTQTILANFIHHFGNGNRLANQLATVSRRIASWTCSFFDLCSLKRLIEFPDVMPHGWTLLITCNQCERWYCIGFDLLCPIYSNMNWRMQKRSLLVLLVNQSHDHSLHVIDIAIYVSLVIDHVHLMRQLPSKSIAGIKWQPIKSWKWHYVIEMKIEPSALDLAAIVERDNEQPLSEYQRWWKSGSLLKSKQCSHFRCLQRWSIAYNRHINELRSASSCFITSKSTISQNPINLTQSITGIYVSMPYLINVVITTAGLSNQRNNHSHIFFFSFW